MLKKLLKHEFKATARYLIPLYIIAFVLTIVDRIVLSFDVFEGYLSIIPGLITVAYVLSLVAVVVVSFLVTILRFYKNLLGDEGYLMYTLPVKPEHLISSKLLTSICWTITSSIVVVISAIGVSSTVDDLKEIPRSLKAAWEQLQASYGAGTMNLFAIEILLLILFSLAAAILMFYASIAIGHLFQGHRIIGAILAYIGIYFVLQIISVILILIAGLFVGIDYFNDFHFVTTYFFPLYILYQIVLSIVYYLITNFILKRKLNLE